MTNVNSFNNFFIRKNIIDDEERSKKHKIQEKKSHNIAKNLDLLTRYVLSKLYK